MNWCYKKDARRNESSGKNKVFLFTEYFIQQLNLCQHEL